MDKFIQMYENIMIKNEELQFFYCGKKIEIVPPVYNFLKKIMIIFLPSIILEMIKIQ